MRVIGILGILVELRNEESREIGDHGIILVLYIVVISDICSSSSSYIDDVYCIINTGATKVVGEYIFNLFVFLCTVCLTPLFW